MIISLAKDTLKWGPAQLEGLSKQVRAGDLTPVLEVYEDDIKAPIRSVITGNLLRSAFIQVQKAKVRCCASWLEGTSKSVTNTDCSSLLLLV